LIVWLKSHIVTALTDILFFTPLTQ